MTLASVASTFDPFCAAKRQNILKKLLTSHDEVMYKVVVVREKG